MTKVPHRPLQNIVFLSSTGRGDDITEYLDSSVCNIPPQLLLKQLREAGVDATEVPTEQITRVEHLGVRVGQAPFSLLTIKGSGDKETLIMQGGVVATPGLLKGINFQKVPGQEALLVKGKDVPRAALAFDQMGVKYVAAGGQLAVTDSTSMYAIALSGGQYTGAHAVLESHGYKGLSAN